MSTSPFSAGKPLSIGRVSGRQRELLAFITESAAQSLGLNLYQPAPSGFFERGTPVRIGFWDRNQLFQWDTAIQEISGPSKESLVIPRPLQAPSVDRRQYRRFPLKRSLSFRVIYASNRRLASPVRLEATTESVSLGGLRFGTQASLKGGDILELELDLSMAESMGAIARVVRSDGRLGRAASSLVGVQFFRLSRKRHEQLQAFLSQSG